MAVVKFILIVLEVLCSLLLIAVILVQRSKDEGLGMAFGAGMGESLFGSRTGNVLTKITIILGSAFLVITMLLALMYSKGASSSVIVGSPIRSSRAPLASPAAPASVPTAPMASPMPAPAPAATEAPMTGGGPAAAPAAAPAAPATPAPADVPAAK